MGILDKIIKKDSGKKAKKNKVQPEKPAEEKPAEEEKEEDLSREEEIISHQILKGIHITEKTVGLEDKNQYVFKVDKKADKNQIKKAVEETYGVDVVGINTINIPRKRRQGRTPGWKKGFKKAVVRIQKGQNIETI